MKTLALNWGVTVYQCSPAVECMVAVGTLRRSRTGGITGINLKFHRRMHPEELAGLVSSHKSAHKHMVYKAPENINGEFVIVSVMREINTDKPATVVIMDEAGNVAGNNMGCGMNAWGNEIHTQALNKFIGREAFINMDASKPTKKVTTVRYKTKVHVRDCRTVRV